MDLVLNVKKDALVVKKIKNQIKLNALIVLQIIHLAIKMEIVKNVLKIVNCVQQEIDVFNVKMDLKFLRIKKHVNVKILMNILDKINVKSV